jgi:tripartite-type tricarboxylate transporter receptor subunit TctC
MQTTRWSEVAAGAVCFGATLGLTMILSLSNAQAQSVEEFYKNKQYKVLVGSTPGGGNDLFARMFAKHFGNHVPGNPTWTVVNMPGAGGILVTQQIYSLQPKDGSVIAAVQRGIPLEPLLSGKNLKYDSLKMKWLGSLNKETNLIIAWHTAPVKKADDLFKYEFICGAAGGGADSLTYPRLLNRTLGTHFKIVTGYAGGEEQSLAMERGEVHGRASVPWTTVRANHGQWLREGKINIIVQMALERDPDLPDVPNILEYVKDPKDRQVFELLFARQETGRPYAAPPEIPADRLAALRAAFDATARDPAFVKDMEQRGGSVELLTAAEMEPLIAKLYRTPEDVVLAARETLRD